MKKIFSLFITLCFTTVMMAETIAGWGAVSLAKDAAVKASSGDTNNKNVATLTSSKALTSKGTKCYYTSSGANTVVTMANLNTTGYTSLSVSFYSRASRKGKVNVTASTDGNTYTTVGSITTTTSEKQYTLSTNIPDNTVSIKFTYAGTSGSFYFGTVELTGTASAPAYSITATSNDGNLGTVSINGNTITATPLACVGYASPAYTVTTGTATVSQNGNTFTVTASSDCNVQINFASLSKDTYIDKVHGTDMTGEAYCGSYEAPTIADKEKVAANEQNGDCEHDHYHFVGWLATGISGSQADEPTGLIKAGTAMTASGKTYYAVWAQEK